MTEVLPLRYMGDGLFRCLHPKRIKLEPGEVHGWTMAEHRSAKSHDHFFAIVNEAWKSLPEEMADDFPNAEALRKWALIKAGFCTETKIVCANNTAAIALVAAAKEMDRYSVVGIEGKLVTIWRADSQRRDAMSRQRFQEAKSRAIDAISQLIGTDAATLNKQEAA